jgi:hypothetical protein
VNPGYTLAHPVYLDVPMMVSFLAALEGGVVISGEETSTETGSRERMLSGKAGLRARLFGIGEAELAAEATAQKRDESSFVSQTQRHHTAASLFNVLYGYLREDDQIVDVSAPQDLSEIRPGQLVEFSGAYLGNPLEDILAFFGALFPYIEPELPPEAQAPIQSPRSGNPARKGAAKVTASVASVPDDPEQNEGLKIIRMMARDLVTAPVHDLLFRTNDELEAVVTVASEFYTATTTENLRAGEFRIVGKVTRVLKDGESINLTRRTVMGAAGPDMARETIGEINDNKELSLAVANPIVNGPALQVLPMSIFL